MTEFKATKLPKADHPAEGETVPDFTRPHVTDEFWEDVALSALTKDGPVGLFFYPMDGTGNAKYTWIGIRKRNWGMSDGATTVVGLSISMP